MVAQAWLDRADAEAVLEAHGKSPIVRGIRHKPRAAASARRVERGAPGSMDDPAFRRGFALLRPNGLSYDLQTPWWHLPAARELADAFGDTQIILNHTGLPSDRSRRGLARLARGDDDARRRAATLRSRFPASARPGSPWSAERQSRDRARRDRHLRPGSRACSRATFPSTASSAASARSSRASSRSRPAFPRPSGMRCSAATRPASTAFQARI